MITHLTKRLFDGVVALLALMLLSNLSVPLGLFSGMLYICPYVSHTGAQRLEIAMALPVVILFALPAFGAKLSAWSLRPRRAICGLIAGG